MSDTNDQATEKFQTQPKQEIRAEVARRLAKAGDLVKEKITDHLFTTELTRRTDATLKVVNDLEAKEKEFAKVSTPDNITYDADGKKIGEGTYSKERSETRKKLREEIGKLESKLGAALEKGDWSKILGG